MRTTRNRPCNALTSWPKDFWFIVPTDFCPLRNVWRDREEGWWGRKWRNLGLGTRHLRGEVRLAFCTNFKTGIDIGPKMQYRKSIHERKVCLIWWKVWKNLAKEIWRWFYVSRSMYVHFAFVLKLRLNVFGNLTCTCIGFSIIFLIKRRNKFTEFSKFIAFYLDCLVQGIFYIYI